MSAPAGLYPDRGTPVGEQPLPPASTGLRFVVLETELVLDCL